MSEIKDGVRIYRQKKNPELVDQVMRINLIKLIAIAVVALIAVILQFNKIAQVYEESKLVLVAAAIVFYVFIGDSDIVWEYLLRPADWMMLRPYLCIVVFAASVVLTLLWKKHRWAVIVHAILYAWLGWQFYVALAPLFSSVAWLYVAGGLWVMTIILYILAWNGNRMVEMKEAEGMNSIFPEQRFEPIEDPKESEKNQ